MILTTLLATASLLGGPAPVQARPTTSEDTAEGAEILRRILVDALDDAFARRAEGEAKTRVRTLDRLGVVTPLWADRETVQHSRVFHLPEVGLFFSLDAALPVVSRDEESASPDKKEKAKDDEWERKRREVRGGSESDGHFFLLGDERVRKEAEIDPKAIDQVIDLVLRTVARHAARIEGLAPRETFTIALRLSGRGQTIWSSRNTWDGGDDEDDDELEPRVQGLPDGHGPEAFAYSLAIAGSPSAREQHLVIRVGLADLAGYAEGNLDSLRQRAQVNRY